MITYSKILHEKAMELVDEAQLAQMEGNKRMAQTLLKDAFLLAQKAVEHFISNTEEEILKYNRIRTAAFLAEKCKEWEAVKRLTQLGLSENPPIFIQEQLRTLQQKVIKQEKQQIFDNQKLIGKLTSADASKNKITIQNIEQHTLYDLFVSTQDMLDLVKQYWLEIVIVEVNIVENGSMVLQKIKRAA